MQLIPPAGARTPALSGALRLAGAAGLAGLGVLLKLAFDSLAFDSGYLALLPPVVVSAVLLGTGPGLVTAAVITILLPVMLAPPLGSFELSTPGNPGRLALFMGDSVMITLLAEAFRRAGSTASQATHRRALLQSLTAKLSTRSTSVSIGATVLAELGDLVRADHGAVVLRNDDHLSPVAIRGFPDEFSAGLEGVTIDAAIPAAISAKTGQEFWFEAGPEFDRAFPDLARVTGLRRVAAAVGVVPIRAHRGEMLGALIMGWQSPRHITADSRALFRTVADLAAAALERASLYEQLAERVKELTLRSEAREAYLAVLSHELRTPVTTIFGTAAVLKKAPGRADAAALINDIVDEAQRLERIVEDLLVLSRVERGTLELEAEPVLLQRIVPGVVGDVQRRFPDAAFELDLDDGIPPAIADVTALRQILTNLATNAAKYARRAGPICLRAVDLGAQVGIIVEDRGPGLGEDPDGLFGLFVRSDHTAKLAAGTGIGLYVVRQLAEAMNGSVTARNRDGGGALFELRLPCARELSEGHAVGGPEPALRQHLRTDSSTPLPTSSA